MNKTIVNAYDPPQKPLDSHVAWIRRFILFHGRPHPQEMGAAEVGVFLTHLAVEGQVLASTQNQALAALVFLYEQVLGGELGWLAGLERAKRPARVPVILSQLSGSPLLHTPGSCARPGSS